MLDKFKSTISKTASDLSQRAEGLSSQVREKTEELKKQASDMNPFDQIDMLKETLKSKDEYIAKLEKELEQYKK